MKSPAHRGRTQAAHVPRLQVAKAMQVDSHRGLKAHVGVQCVLAGSCMLNRANLGQRVFLGTFRKH